MLVLETEWVPMLPNSHLAILTLKTVGSGLEAPGDVEVLRGEPPGWTRTLIKETPQHCLPYPCVKTQGDGAVYDPGSGFSADSNSVTAPVVLDFQPPGL